VVVRGAPFRCSWAFLLVAARSMQLSAVDERPTTFKTTKSEEIFQEAKVGLERASDIRSAGSESEDTNLHLVSIFRASCRAV
jgi:hypothetical protein